MLLSESKFNLQSIKVDQESDQDLTQKFNLNLIEEVISIQNQIIASNCMNQLCINIQTAIKQNRKTCQDIDLDNCQVLDEVL
jgi:tartrate dehydratase alpha subunit/fumarate hydratase class I-like protein